MPSLTLYGYCRSSCSARLRIALDLKAIEYKPIYVNLDNGENLKDEYSAKNPSRSVPTLMVDDSWCIPQSVAALEYLEEAYPQLTSLLPADAKSRADVRTLTYIITIDTQPLTNDTPTERAESSGAKPEEWLKFFTERGLKAFETVVSRTAGRYCCGDAITLADVCLVPALWNAEKNGVVDKQIVSYSPTTVAHNNIKIQNSLPSQHNSSSSSADKMPGLTTRDSFVLKSLFDPEASTASTKHASSQTSLPGMTEAQFSVRRSTELRIISQLQNDTPNAETVQRAVQDLSSLIEESPGYASAYINRAQASRLLIPTSGLFTFDHAQASGQLLKDLQKGIQLAEPTNSSQQLSTHQTTVLAAAYTHRGFLLLKIADIIRNGEQVHGVGNKLQSASAESVEEQASQDFAAGGQYGSKEAREMAVRTNPYAKMCGAIVKEAIKKEVEEWKADQLC
ncbi:hypothetical protein E4T50_14072 [Aureobasidium sp. EXF-12298]|nr:hypothetical protein E4T50_14072 [Aureobasidium sp. EXF-12298]